MILPCLVLQHLLEPWDGIAWCVVGHDACDACVLIASSDPKKLDAAAVRFLGRTCLERSFITLDDAQLLVASVLTQLERADDESRAGFGVALRHLRLKRAARQIGA